jgi:glutamate racemase
MTAAPARRIAMLDSGLGGLTVLSALRALTGDLQIVYFADTAHVPYGDRSFEDVASLGASIVKRLVEHHPALIVVASGTTCAAFDHVGWPDSGVDLVGIVTPGARAACDVSARGRIGVIATNATIKSGIFERRILEIRPDAVVENVGAPALVPIVESGGWTTTRARDAVTDYCGSFIDAECDTVVLGCTHFPHLRPWFEAALGPGVRLVDPATACAHDVAARLVDLAPCPDSNEFEVSGDPEAFAANAAMLSGISVDALRGATLQATRSDGRGGR